MWQIVNGFWVIFGPKIRTNCSLAHAHILFKKWIVLMRKCFYFVVYLLNRIHFDKNNHERKWMAKCYLLFIQSKIYSNILSFTKAFILLAVVVARTHTHAIHFIIRNNFPNWLNFMRIIIIITYMWYWIFATFFSFTFIDQCLKYQCQPLSYCFLIEY